jgi:uncharacterized protein (DUF427 family)
VRDHPHTIVPAGHVEPAPRRVRAVLGGTVVLDTVRALYLWEWPYYPQYHIPLADVRTDLLVDGQPEDDPRGIAALGYGLRSESLHRPDAALVYPGEFTDPASATGPAGTVRFRWSALDAWFEEEEEVFVHPRNPYTRVDALRSGRSVRIERDGVLLAESSSPVMVFETGLPTRYYLDRATVNFGYLRASDTVTACPYKGRTSGYWSVRIGTATYPDLAWTYQFPTRELSPIAGLVAFYNEQVDIALDGVRQQRPTTHFFS